MTAAYHEQSTPQVFDKYVREHALLGCPTMLLERKDHRQFRRDKRAHGNRVCNLLEAHVGAEGVPTVEHDIERETSAFHVAMQRATARLAALSLRHHW